MTNDLTIKSKQNPFYLHYRRIMSNILNPDEFRLDIVRKTILVISKQADTCDFYG